MAGDNLYVKKIIKYTTSDAKEYVEKFEGIKPDVVAFQLTCNEVENRDKTEDNITEEVSRLVQTVGSQFGDIPIIVSLPLPNRDTLLNDKSAKLTDKMIDKLSKYKNVHFSQNHNMRFRGRPLEGVLYDQKHLSSYGTELLTENLRSDINLALRRR